MKDVILLVDGDDDFRRMLRAALETAGHRVVDARSANEALREARSHDVQLVVADVVMPDMSGRVLVERLRRDGHACRVVFMSKHANEYVAAQGVLEPGERIVCKRLAADVLVARVRELIMDV